tara:strand:+ start:1538 stop:1720 length:183 start_codon:yes stop_codon:yes gene_type:complete
MIQLTVNKEEHKLILEMIEVFTLICADDQKIEFAKEILKGLEDVKKQTTITDVTEPGICD